MVAERILAFGDSHTCFWSGENLIRSGAFPSSAFMGIDVLHLGPITAHGISTTFKPHSGTERLTDYLANKKDTYGCLLSCFGEIDCRCHIVKLAAQKSISIEAIAKETACHYFEFVERMSELHQMPCIIWGPIPSTPPGAFSFNPAFPAVGSMLERNHATFIFNETLCQLASRNASVAHINVFNDITDNFFVTDPGYLFDGCHLSNVFLKQAAAKLESALISMGAHTLLPAVARIWPITSEVGLRNVAAGKPYSSSSIWRGTVAMPFEGGPSGHYEFHTDIEDAPHIIIDLESAFWIERIVIHNRQDGCQERSRSVAVALSNNRADYEPLFVPPENEWADFGASKEALVVEVKPTAPYRFVKLYLRERNYFHLDCVQIYVRSFMLPPE